MFIDTATIKYLARFYTGEFPVRGLHFTMSLFRYGKFTAKYKARCIMKILYLDNLLEQDNITAAGWNAIEYRL